MHKLVWSVLGLLFTLAMLLVTAQAQHTRMIKGEPGKIWMLGELNAAITTSGDTTKVEFVSEAANRSAAYKSVDLQEGDIIAMVAGKKVTQASDIEKAYDALKVGEALKLGIKRGAEMKIVSIVKADPKDLPQRKMVMGGPEIETTHGGGGVSRQLKIPDGVANPTVLMTAGLLVGDKDGKVMVIDVMPHGQSLYPNEAVKAEDIIASFLGKPVTSSKEVEAALEKIAVGEKVTMTVARGGKESTVTFAKSEAAGNVVIKKD